MAQGSESISPFEIMGKMSKRKRRRSHPMNVPNHAPDPYAGYKKAEAPAPQSEMAPSAQASPAPENVQAPAESSPKKIDDDANPIFESKLLNVWQAPVTLRLPRGMLVIGFLCVTALVMLGYKAGEIAGKRQWQDILKADSETGKTDLLALNLSQPATFADPKKHPSLQPSPRMSLTNKATENSLKVIPEKKIGDLEWLEGRGDPRVKDHLYFVLIHANQKYAEKVVHFLGQEGVESAAIRRDNARLFKVVLLEGFAPDEEKSRTEYYMDFRARIRQLGRRWKSKMGGATAWEDFFTQKFDGKKEATVIRTRQIK